MSSFVIKIIACLFMFFDHIKYAIPELENFISLYLGRIAFPLFAFLITEGYAHTKDVYKYRTRLFIAALISQVPFFLFRLLVGRWDYLNIIFGFFIGVNALIIYDKFDNKLIPITIGVLFAILAEVIHIEYGWFAIVLVLMFHILKKKKVLMSIIFTLVVVIYYYFKIGVYIFNDIKAFGYVACTLIPLAFILLYNGKKGKDDKRFFYYFYPIHLLVLYLISFIK